MSSTFFFSKILLFGEYGIIKGSKGIAIPFSKYSGRLIKNFKGEVDSHLQLNDFYKYLCETSILSQVLNLDKMGRDIDSGLIFNSNIPLGHGVGSSGAVCASIFAEYAYKFERKKSYTNDELKYLQDLMALMESYYHGASSGLDCLISLINLPVVIEGRNKLEIINLPKISTLGYFYLIDTGIERKTSPLVHTFLKNYEEDENFRLNINEFITSTNRVIENMLDANRTSFIESFTSISKNQFLNFTEMIPQTLKDFWLKGIESKEYMVKLCGAGGGGFFLIYAERKQNWNRKDIIDLNQFLNHDILEN